MKLIRKWYPLWWLYRLYLSWHKHDVWQWAGWITPDHPLVKQKAKELSPSALIEFVARIPWAEELGAPMHYPAEVLADLTVPRNCYGHSFLLVSLLIAAGADARCVKGRVYNNLNHCWGEWRIEGVNRQGDIRWQVDTRQKPYMFILGSEGDKMGHRADLWFTDLQVGK